MRTGGANLCTDPDCFEMKKTAHLQRAAEAHAAKGAIVVTGNKARAAIGADGKVKGDYIALDDVKRALKSKAGAPKASELPVVLIQDPRTGKTVQAVKRFDLVAKGLADKATPADSTAALRERAEAYRAKLAKKVDAEATRRMGLLYHVRDQAAGRELGTFELRMVVAAALQGVQWNDRPTLAKLHGCEDTHEGQRALQIKIDTLDAGGLTRLLLDCLLVDSVRVRDEYSLSRKPGPLLALADHYGVDAEAVMRAAALAAAPPAPPAAPTSTPSTAGAGAKQGKAAQAKKPARPPVAYRCPDTLMTWSGRGLQPAWLKAALAKGTTLASLAVQDKAKAAPAKAGLKVKDDAGAAGETVRDPNTVDMFEAAHA
jgi:hypothetical protein